ncbi:MAG: hypothetical protein IPM42_19315 [Saprospiraceae bacterium]|nr:hypothetical protein [Saprospiraceae bacterium]
MIRNIKIIITFSLLLASFLVKAQQGTVKDTTIKLNQVEVIKEFEVTLEDAKKIRVNPIITSPAPTIRSYNYDITIVPAKINYPGPEIRPLAMPTEEPFAINNGFLKLGYGTLKSPFLDAGYHFGKKELYNVLFRAGYHASDNSANVPFQKYSNLNLGVSGDYLIRENTKVFGSIDGNFQKRNFYQTHIGVDTLYSPEESERGINHFKINAGLFNPERTSSDLNYKIDLTLQNARLTDQKISESQVNLNGSIQKHRSQNTIFDLTTKFDVININTKPSSSLFNAHLIPKIILNYTNLRIAVGGNLFFDKSNTAAWPEADISFNVHGKQVQLFTGTTQNYFTNGLVNQSEVNPFLNAQLDTLGNNIFKDIYAGMKGEFAFISYQFQAGYKISRNHAFFISDTLDFRRFNQTYDDVNIFYVSGNIDFAITSDISVGGTVIQNQYSLKNLPKAWHLPQFQANGYASFSFLKNKLQLRSELFMMDRVDFINVASETVKSNLLFDFNVLAEFRPLKNIGIYAKALNIANNKFERWYGYPTVGINLHAGVSIIF